MRTKRSRIKLFSILCVSLLSTFAIAFLQLFDNQPNPQSQNGKVHIKRESSGYRLYKDGKPFIIKGASGYTNLLKLQDVGGNTIRTYDTTNLRIVLDSAHAHGLSVIVGIPMPNSQYYESFYSDSTKVGSQYRAVLNLVESYKNHPALLIWCLGNELDITLNPLHYPFYRAYNNLLRVIKEHDPDHPVTTTLVNVQKRSLVTIRLLLANLDFISINAFGRVNHIQEDLENFSWFWNGPFLLTEWGINGPWEAVYTAWNAPIEYTSTQKAQLHQQIFSKYLDSRNGRCLGTLIFYWGHKQEKTHTWFSLFSEHGAASETVETLRYLWTGKQPLKGFPKIYSMLLDGKQARDNLILASNTVHTAHVSTDQDKNNNLEFKWEILPEDRYSVFTTNVNKPKPVQNSIISTTYNTAVFKTPATEGPYRIFVEMVDKGKYATMNFPFYVVK